MNLDMGLAQVDGHLGNLLTAQLLVMESVPYVKKSKAKNLNYTFATEADLIGALRPAMVKHGLTIRPTDITVVSETEYQTKSGTRMVNCRGIVEYTVEHAWSGESTVVTVLAEASDSGDKAAAKMMTIAMKYGLRQFFLIETGDDPDMAVHGRAAEDSEAQTRFGKIDLRIQAATDLSTLDDYKEKLQALPPTMR